MGHHTSDLIPGTLDISPEQVANYLLSHGWILENTIAAHHIFSLDHSDKGCKLLLPVDRNSSGYEHRLLDILLVLQLLRSPSVGDIANEIKHSQSQNQLEIEIKPLTDGSGATSDFVPNSILLQLKKAEIRQRVCTITGYSVSKLYASASWNLPWIVCVHLGSISDGAVPVELYTFHALETTAVTNKFRQLVHKYTYTV